MCFIVLSLRRSADTRLLESEQTPNGSSAYAGAAEKKPDAGGGTVVEGAEPPDDRCCLLRLCDFPASVFFIIGNEFCERFSYYGMKGTSICATVVYMCTVFEYWSAIH